MFSYPFKRIASAIVIMVFIFTTGPLPPALATQNLKPKELSESPPEVVAAVVGELQRSAVEPPPGVETKMRGRLPKTQEALSDANRQVLTEIFSREDRFVGRRDRGYRDGKMGYLTPKDSTGDRVYDLWEILDTQEAKAISWTAKKLNQFITDTLPTAEQVFAHRLNLSLEEVRFQNILVVHRGGHPHLAYDPGSGNLEINLGNTMEGALTVNDYQPYLYEELSHHLTLSQKNERPNNVVLANDHVQLAEIDLSVPFMRPLGKKKDDRDIANGLPGHAFLTIAGITEADRGKLNKILDSSSYVGGLFGEVVAKKIELQSFQDQVIEAHRQGVRRMCQSYEEVFDRHTANMRSGYALDGDEPEYEAEVLQFTAQLAFLAYLADKVNETNVRDWAMERGRIYNESLLAVFNSYAAPATLFNDHLKAYRLIDHLTEVKSLAIDAGASTQNAVLSSGTPAARASASEEAAAEQAPRIAGGADTPVAVTSAVPQVIEVEVEAEASAFGKPYTAEEIQGFARRLEEENISPSGLTDSEAEFQSRLAASLFEVHKDQKMMDYEEVVQAARDFITAEQKSHPDFVNRVLQIAKQEAPEILKKAYEKEFFALEKFEGIEVEKPYWGGLKGNAIYVGQKDQLAFSFAIFAAYAAELSRAPLVLLVEDAGIADSLKAMIPDMPLIKIMVAGKLEDVVNVMSDAAYFLNTNGASEANFYATLQVEGIAESGFMPREIPQINRMNQLQEELENMGIFVPYISSSEVRFWKLAQAAAWCA